MSIPTNFNGLRLRGHAWVIPFKLTFALLAAFYLCRLMPVIVNYPLHFIMHVPYHLFGVVYSSGPIPPALAAFFGVCAVGWGLGFANSAKKALASSLGVTELGPDAPLTQRVHRMAKQLDLPLPRVAVMRPANAYAIGSSPKDAAVVIGLPLIQGLSEEELDAIIGHELGHIVTGDMRRMQMAAGFQSMVDGMTDKASQVGARQSRSRQNALLIYLFGQILRKTLFLISELLVKRLSRTREYTADAFGALLTSPAAMASALRKLHDQAPPRPDCNARYACLMFWSAGGHMFSTHPTLQRRLGALERGRHLDRIITKGCNARGANAQAVAETCLHMLRSGAAYAFALLADQFAKLRMRDMPSLPSSQAVLVYLESHMYLVATAGVGLGVVLTNLFVTG
jgi:heat shock protein HtpX